MYDHFILFPSNLPALSLFPLQQAVICVDGIPYFSLAKIIPSKTSPVFSNITLLKLHNSPLINLA